MYANAYTQQHDIEQVHGPESEVLCVQAMLALHLYIK
jgi:hypothetical protein